MRTRRHGKAWSTYPFRTSLRAAYAVHLGPHGETDLDDRFAAIAEEWEWDFTHMTASELRARVVEAFDETNLLDCIVEGELLLRVKRAISTQTLPPHHSQVSHTTPTLLLREHGHY